MGDLGSYIDPSKLKDIFNKITEFDSDPSSKKAQDFYKKLDEIERQNPKKKKSQIIIKTMKKGRTISKEQLDSFSLGQRLSEEEEEFKRKFIDWKSIQFPQVNPVELVSKSGKSQYKLNNYRYPSQTGETKGIIQFIHGYGDYCARYAYFAKKFAEQGYDVVGFD